MSLPRSRAKRHSYPSRIRGGSLLQEDREWILSYRFESSLERSVEEDAEAELSTKKNPVSGGSVSSLARETTSSPTSQMSFDRDMANLSVDSAYFSPGSVSSDPPSPAARTRTRSSTWVASLRSLLLQKQRSQSAHRRPQVVVPEGLCGNSVGTAPQNEVEMDRFLAEVWSKEAAEDSQRASSQYVRKITELKSFYELKMAEIAQREATYLSEYHDETTPLLTADQLSMHTDASLRRVLLEAQVRHKFKDLRFKMKQEITQTILSLRGQHVDTGHRRRRLRPKATKLMTQWFEDHLDNPYPSEHEKRVLASQCDVTAEQVSNWFSNKRCRSKSLVLGRSRRRNCATL